VTEAGPARAEYGWRARIGMLKPSPVIDNNAHEFYLMAPEGVELFVTSMGVSHKDQSEYDKAVAGLHRPLSLLVRHEPQVILQAGVPPIVTRGWGFEGQVLARVREITSIPFFTDVGSSIRALQALDASRIVMLSFGFDDALSRQIGEYLRRGGIELVGWARVQASSEEDAARVSLEIVHQRARDLFEAHRSVANGIWITHASMPSVAVLDDLERELDVPVVSSAQALMWAGLRAAGILEPIPGFGRLLTQP
jgi:maleate isomerase